MASSFRFSPLSTYSPIVCCIKNHRTTFAMLGHHGRPYGILENLLRNPSTWLAPPKSLSNLFEWVGRFAQYTQATTRNSIVVPKLDLLGSASI